MGITLKQNDMPLSSEWISENTIYKTNIKNRDMSKLIYRSSNGFEAFVTGETEDCLIIEGNGVHCKVIKASSKNKIKKVSSDYSLRKFTFSK